MSSDVDLNVFQTYTVTRVRTASSTVISGTSTNHNLFTAPPNIGPRSNPSYAATAIKAGGPGWQGLGRPA